MEALRLKKSVFSVKVTIIVFWIIFLFFAIVNVFPICWSFINSMKTGSEYFDDSMSLPTVWRFENYIKVFTEFKYRKFMYMDMLFNSVWMLVVRVFVNVTSSALLAYALAKYRFPGKNLIYTVVIIANTIPIIGTGSAAFRLMKALDMINNPSTIWLAWAGGFDFAFIILFGNFNGISAAYSEAARIDGANEFFILFKVILPQAAPCIIAIAIQQAIGVWNDYETVMIYMRNYPNLAYGLYLFNTNSNYVEDSRPIYFCAAIISCIPVIFLYAISQNLILTNVTAGGLKG